MIKQQFRDKVLRCCDCEQSFIFTAGEQAYFFSKSLTEPRRCRACRALRKATLIPDEGVSRER